MPDSTNQQTTWLEAEQFDDCGGWRNDSQFVDFVGSPYLLAAGVGKPVSDAVTGIQVAAARKYRLWVRCKDWLPEHSPGRFQVVVNGCPSDVTFGRAEDDSWRWVAGGEFDLPSGLVEIRLHDLTGWWARCDALVLTSDPSFVPSDEPAGVLKQREQYGAISKNHQHVGPLDLIVAGGGLAGVTAAVAAARRGVRVALIQDRPVLGGNGSSEIQVPVQGDLTYEPWDPRETGLIEEFDPLTAGHGPWSANLEKVARAEPNLRLWLNVRLTGVEMEGSTRIHAVRGLDTVTGERLRFAGKLFIDCTGDAWLGYWAGADYRHGQEARHEHNEPMAPEEPDGCTQSSSLNAGRFKGHDQPVTFEAPEWAHRWNSPEEFQQCSMGAVWNNGFRLASFDDLTQGRGRHPQNARAPVQEWYAEFGGRYNTIENAEWIRDELFRINIGIWDYVKNRHPLYKQKNACRELIWLNYVVGKRESRRLLGDYILSQNDIAENRSHEDTVAYAGWVLDVHHPCGFFTAGPQAHLEHMGRSAIPFRCLYSRNIDNLMMAGRNISVTHVALGKTRVMRTCALTGWAAGLGAAIAIREQSSPRLVGSEHIQELQQSLLKDGGFLPGVQNMDRRDLGRRIRVSASSFATICDPKYLVTLPHYYWKAKHPLDTGLAVQFRAWQSRVDSVSLFLRSHREEAAPLQLKLYPSRWGGDLENFAAMTSARAVVPPRFEGWVEFPLQATLEPGCWYFMALPKTAELFWDLYKYHPPNTWRGYATPPGWSCEWGCHKFRLNPGGEPAASKYIAEHGPRIEFRPENLLSGISRCVEGDPNSWAPDPEAPLPQWVELDFEEQRTFNEIHIAFQMNILAAKAYSVMAYTDAGWRTLFRESNNRDRRRVHRFRMTRTDRIRLILEERSDTAEVPLTPVCEIRVYHSAVLKSHLFGKRASLRVTS